MAAYRRVYDSRHLQADCQEPGSAPEPYARQSSMRYPFIEMNSLRGLSDLDVVSTYRRRFPNFVRRGGAGGGRDVPRPRRQHRSAPLPRNPRPSVTGGAGCGGGAAVARCRSVSRRAMAQQWAGQSPGTPDCTDPESQARGRNFNTRLYFTTKCERKNRTETGLD